MAFVSGKALYASSEGADWPAGVWAFHFRSSRDTACLEAARRETLIDARALSIGHGRVALRWLHVDCCGFGKDGYLQSCAHVSDLNR